MRLNQCLMLVLAMSISSWMNAAALQPDARSTGSTANDSCAQSWVDIEGNRIWMDKEGAGDTTVVFESGFGNDSSVWSQIAPTVRSFGVRTFVYDRAGMGKSTINTNTPYSLDNDVHILRSALGACGITERIVFVGHSYGGAIGLVAASEDTQFRGLVLLDAVVPGVWAKGEVEKSLQTMRAQYADIRGQAPELAKVAIPWAEAMPKTAERVNSLRISDTLPIMDIVAEKGESDKSQTWRDAHERFTANNSCREHIFAVGSSHKIMIDKPELVVKSIQRMIDKVNGK